MHVLENRMAAVRPVNPQWCLPLVQRLAYLLCSEEIHLKIKTNGEFVVRGRSTCARNY